MEKRRQHGVDMQPTRRYLAELGYAIDPAELIEREEQRLSTLCYLRVDDHLLLLRREKEPFSQHWTAPGGKIEDGEDPLQAVVREFNEETQLTLHDPVLKAICSEVGEPGYNWLLFVFYCERYSGEPVSSSEGELRWMPLEERETWLLPSIDRQVLPYILDLDAPLHFIRVEYTSDHDVKEFTVRPLEEI